MRVLILVRSLRIGGAEAQLGLLAPRLRSAGHEVTVAILYPGGEMAGELASAGVPIRSLEKGGRHDNLGLARRLFALVAELRPDVVYGMLTAANLLTALLRLRFPRLPVVWGLRGEMLLAESDRWVRLTSALEPALSRLASRVVCNSASGADAAAARGVPRAKLAVVRNGLDTARFRHDPAGRERVRGEWGIGERQALVGMIGRLDPIKDHRALLEAAATLAGGRPELRLVFVGEGPADYAAGLRLSAEALGVAARLVWAGARRDMPAVHSALDVLALPSLGEGLPNVVAEAMACGTPCVVSDVGDAAWLVGDTGAVVAPGDRAALAAALDAAIARTSSAGEREGRRRRVEELLGVDRLVRETEAVLEAAVRG